MFCDKLHLQLHITDLYRNNKYNFLFLFCVHFLSFVFFVGAGIGTLFIHIPLFSNFALFLYFYNLLAIVYVV